MGGVNISSEVKVGTRSEGGKFDRSGKGQKKHDDRALERERTLLAAFGVVNALAAGLTGATVGREQGASENQVARCLTDPI